MLKVKTEKVCNVCSKTLPISEFYTNGIHTNVDGSKTQRYKPCCKLCENNRTLLSHYSKVKAILEESGRSWACEVCGYDEYIAALEFHHINPEEKDFQINKYKNSSVDKLRPEINKCVVLCSNCHRIEHSIHKVKVLEV